MEIKDYKWVRRVCIVDSSYSLLLYFMISSIDEINATFFVWGNGVPKKTRSFFKEKSVFIINDPKDTRWRPKSMRSFFWQLYYYYIGSYIDYPFLRKKNITYWGHDHLFYSPYFFHGNKYNAIEDGLLNYKPQPESTSYPFFKKMLCGGPLAIRHNYRFQQSTCEHEYLTGIVKDAPCMESSKAIVKSIKQLWDEQTEVKKNIICTYYDLTKEEIDKLKTYSVVILTQPFSEDRVLTEEEKVEMYREQISSIDKSEIVIKPHPRETTDYNLYFPDTFVFNKKIPMELLNLLGIHFSVAYTVSSTSAFNISESIVMWGTEINEKLLKKYPRYTSDLLRK